MKTYLVEIVKKQGTEAVPIFVSQLQNVSEEFLEGYVTALKQTHKEVQTFVYYNEIK